MIRMKLITMLDFSIYFFRKSKQKASSFSNRFAFKVVQGDISLIKKDISAVTFFNEKLT